MKSFIAKIVAGVLLLATLAGCHTIRQETAIEWMDSHPWSSDSPS